MAEGEGEGEEGWRGSGGTAGVLGVDATMASDGQKGPTSPAGRLQEKGAGEAGEEACSRRRPGPLQPGEYSGQFRRLRCRGAAWPTREEDPGALLTGTVSETSSPPFGRSGSWSSAH